MARPRLNDERAFSLLEIMAAIGIVAVILVMVNLMARSFKAHSDLTETRSRMDAIVEAAKAHYVHHQNLPRVTEDGGIPLGPGGFDVDAKLRFDGWQRPMRYISRTNDGELDRPGDIHIDQLFPYAGVNRDTDPPAILIPRDTRTVLRAIQFEGRMVAGLIISSGPNEQFEYRTEPGSPESYVLTPGSDDIIVPIDLTEEASRIALAELRVLNEKAAAFEDRYLGIDNDQDGRFDEGGCIPIPPIYSIPSSTVRLQGSCDNWQNRVSIRQPDQPPPATNRDINCGKPTLDYMKANFCRPPFGTCPPGYYRPGRGEVQVYADVVDASGVVTTVFCGSIPPQVPGPAVARVYDPIGGVVRDCSWGLVETQFGTPPNDETKADQARAFIRCLYGLRPDDVVDPWLNGYVWGCGSLCPEAHRYAPHDPHHRRFFSAGPDGIPAAPDVVGQPPIPDDDIIS